MLGASVPERPEKAVRCVSPKCLDRGRGLGPQFPVHIAPTCQRDCQAPYADVEKRGRRSHHDSTPGVRLQRAGGCPSGCVTQTAQPPTSSRWRPRCPRFGDVTSTKVLVRAQLSQRGALRWDCGGAWVRVGASNPKLPAQEVGGRTMVTQAARRDISDGGRDPKQRSQLWPRLAITR
jgi:hypothetical protein